MATCTEPSPKAPGLPVAAADWPDLVGIVGSGHSGPVALPPALLADRPLRVPAGCELELLGCATALRCAPGLDAAFVVEPGASLAVKGSLLVEPPAPGTHGAVFSVAEGATLTLDAALLAASPSPTSTCLVHCAGTLLAGACTALDGWCVTATGGHSPCAVRVRGNGALFVMEGGRVSRCRHADGASEAPSAAVQVLDGASFLLRAGSVRDNGLGAGDPAALGGGVYCNGGTVAVEGGSIEGNAALDGGGVFAVGRGRVVLVDGPVRANRALRRGGAVFSTAATALEGGEMTANRAALGGGVYSAGSLTCADGAVVAGNSADTGGGVYNQGSCSMDGGTVAKNAADGFQGSGGGVFNTGRLRLGQAIVAGNRAMFCGGGVYNAQSGRLQLEGAGLSNNRSLYGGGVYNAQGTMVGTSGDIVDNCANSTQYGGGGVYNTGRVALSHVAIVHNASQGMGGGLYNAGDVVLDASGLSHNAGMNGGGIYNRGSVIVDGTALVRNAAGDMGGAVVNTGTLTMGGCTVASNSARRGGGVLNAGTAAVMGSAVGRNEAPEAPDFFNYLDDGSRGTFTLDTPDGDPAYDGLAWHEQGEGAPGRRFSRDGEPHRLELDPVWEVRFAGADDTVAATWYVRPDAPVGPVAGPVGPGVFQGWVDASSGLLWDFASPVTADLLLKAVYAAADLSLPGPAERRGPEGPVAALPAGSSDDEDDAPREGRSDGSPFDEGDDGPGPVDPVTGSPLGGGQRPGKNSPLTSAVVTAARAAGAISGLVRRRGGGTPRK